MFPTDPQIPYPPYPAPDMPQVPQYPIQAIPPPQPFQAGGQTHYPSYFPTANIQIPQVPETDPIKVGIQIGLLGAASGLGYATIRESIRRSHGEPVGGTGAMLRPLLMGAVIGAGLGTAAAVKLHQNTPRRQVGSWDDVLQKQGSMEKQGIAIMTAIGLLIAAGFAVSDAISIAKRTPKLVKNLAAGKKKEALIDAGNIGMSAIFMAALGSAPLRAGGSAVKALRAGKLARWSKLFGRTAKIRKATMAGRAGANTMKRLAPEVTQYAGKPSMWRHPLQANRLRKYDKATQAWQKYKGLGGGRTQAGHFGRALEPLAAGIGPTAQRSGGIANRLMGPAFLASFAIPYETGKQPDMPTAARHGAALAGMRAAAPSARPRRNIPTAASLLRRVPQQNPVAFQIPNYYGS